ncbi:carbohydrate porin [Gemmatimonadota bacterium]
MQKRTPGMDAGTVWARCLVLTTVVVGPWVGTLTAQQIGGGRWQVSSHPPEISLVVGYAADGFLPARGGLFQEPVALDNLDLLLHLNLRALPGFRGTSIQVHVQSNRGGSVSSKVGALQGISNLEAVTEWRLYEAWIEHRVRSPRISILVGVYDINSEFDVIPSAGDFLNSSFGFGPEYGLSGVAGPSTYPSTAFATRVMLKPLPSLYGLLGLSDAVPGDSGGGRFALDSEEGALLSFEVGYARLLSSLAPVLDRGRHLVQRGRGSFGPQRRRIGRGRPIEPVSTKVAIGGWAYSRQAQSWAPGGPLGRSWGVYLLGEHLLYQDEDGAGRLSGFARVGTAADGINRLDLSLIGGLAFRGAIPGRPDDVAGLGIAHARNGSPFLREQRRAGLPAERGETVFEMTYRAAVCPFFFVQPDLQFVMKPGMNIEVPNALVFGLRGHFLLEMSSS